jgi:LPXTG-site transpeptidase (sortase) family protein
VSILKFHKKREWEFRHRGKHDISLCEKIQVLVDAVDFQHAKHNFFSAFLHIQDQVKDQCFRVIHHRESVFSKFRKSLLKKTLKGIRKHILRSKFHSKKQHFKHVKKTIIRTKERVLEVLHMDEIIEQALHSAARKRLINGKFKDISRTTGEVFNKNITQPIKEVCKLPFSHRFKRNMIQNWYKFKVSVRNAFSGTAHGAKSALRPVLSIARITAVFAIIFAGTFTILNIEALTTVSVDYMKNNTFLASHFDAKQAAETYVQEESLAAPPQDLVLAEKEREQNEKNGLILPPLDIEVTPDENRLYIPSIGKNIPIANVVDEKVILNPDPQDTEDAIQEALKDGVVRYPGTAIPGHQGNVALTGHSSFYFLAPGEYKDVFALLHKVNLEDEIIIYYGEKKGDQKKHRYRVTEIKEVKPHEVDILKQTDDYRLTLITCTPIGTTLRRLVVTAVQVE